MAIPFNQSILMTDANVKILFGDQDTYIYESSDDVLGIYQAGALKYKFDSGSFMIMNTASVYTQFNSTGYVAVGTDLLIEGAIGNAGHTQGWDTVIRSGYGYSSGNTNGGHLYIQRAFKFGTGIDGNIYIGSGSSCHLDTNNSETYVVTINSGSGLLSKRLASTLGTGGGVTLTGSTNNTICTVTGTDAIQGEANLTFDGSILSIAGDLTFGNGANRTITVANSAASTAGRNVTLQAGTAVTSGFGGGHLYLLGGNAVATAQSGHVIIHGGTVSTIGNIYLAHNTTTAYGYVGIRVAPSSSYALKIAGEVYSDDDFRGLNFNLISDIRLKTNIISLKPEYLDIDYSSFEFKSKLGQKRYGVIAQQIREKYPELVRETNDELAVAYTDLLIREVAYLKNKVKELEEKFN